MVCDAIPINYGLPSCGFFFFMAALRSRCGRYIVALGFLSSFFFFASPNLSRHRLDVYHTSTHDVALVRIYNAGLKCAPRSSLEMQDPKMYAEYMQEYLLTITTRVTRLLLVHIGLVYYVC